MLNLYNLSTQFVLLYKVCCVLIKYTICKCFKRRNIDLLESKPKNVCFIISFLQGIFALNQTTYLLLWDHLHWRAKTNIIQLKQKYQRVSYILLINHINHYYRHKYFSNQIKYDIILILFDFSEKEPKIYHKGAQLWTNVIFVGYVSFLMFDN